MKKLLLIVNPKSGKGQIKNHLLHIIDMFVKNDYDVTAYTTQATLDAKRKVLADGCRYDLIVCSGGDGTLNEVVSGIMEKGLNIPVGYIPAGSTNDFASSLHLPKNMKKSAEITMKGTPFLCDVGIFNDRYFNYVAAFGAFTIVSYATSQQMKNVLGHQAYILEAMKRFSSIKASHMIFSCDENVIEGDFIFGMITNSSSVGGFKNIIGQHVLLDDGLFEVTLIEKPKSAIEMQEILTALIMVDAKSDRVHVLKTSKLRISSPEEIAWVLDGEYGGTPNTITIENCKQALKIICS
ncbi:MAG: YegS/Rv2252/BmrU family lipid kinase [Clostridiales bacterium]|nr:YegS/Rv2252/BmrU family lipid kinase [Clostridiales bacterium]